MFPQLESNTLEFKETFTNLSNDKIHATLCGFLNSQGGYLVFGVEDSGRIKGLRGAPKDFDAYMLRLDNIYHLNMITEENGDKLSPSCILSKVIQVTPEKKIIVTTARPDPGKKYRTRDGAMWYRLSASNYRVQDVSYAQELSRLTTELELATKSATAAKKEADCARAERNAAQDRLKLENRRLTETLEKMMQLREDTAALIEGARKAEESLAEIVRGLETEILHKKNKAEKEIEAARQPWIFATLSSLATLFSCFSARATDSLHTG